MKEKRGKAIRPSSEVIKIIDLAPFKGVGQGDEIRLRVEFYRELSKSKLIKARLWRREFFRLRPRFSTISTRLITSDEIILVEESGIVGIENIATRSWRAGLVKVLSLISKQFCIK